MVSPLSGYVKIYGSILGSSVWAESAQTRIVWITMLAVADADGRVEASVSGLARFANVSVAQCRAALSVLSSPDLDDRSGVNDGCRIEKHQGGWTIVNYLRYREMRSPKQVADAERQRLWREANRVVCDKSQSHSDIAATVDVDEAVAVVTASSSPPPSPPQNASVRFDAKAELLGRLPLGKRPAWEAELFAARDGMHGPVMTDDQIDVACRDFLANGGMDSEAPSLKHLRGYLRNHASPTATTRAAATPRLSRQEVGRAHLQNWLNEKAPHGE